MPRRHQQGNEGQPETHHAPVRRDRVLERLDRFVALPLDDLQLSLEEYCFGIVRGGCERGIEILVGSGKIVGKRIELRHGRQRPGVGWAFGKRGVDRCARSLGITETQVGNRQRVCQVGAPFRVVKLDRAKLRQHLFGIPLHQQSARQRRIYLLGRILELHCLAQLGFRGHRIAGRE